MQDREELMSMLQSRAVEVEALALADWYEGQVVGGDAPVDHGRVIREAGQMRA